MTSKHWEDDYYPIILSLNDPDGGTLRFHSSEDVINYFFARHFVTHKGKVMLPCDFKLFIRGREYGWPNFRHELEPGSTDAIAFAVKKHVEYVLDLDNSFYVNITHEEDLPPDSC